MPKFSAKTVLFSPISSVGRILASGEAARNGKKYCAAGWCTPAACPTRKFRASNNERLCWGANAFGVNAPPWNGCSAGGGGVGDEVGEELLSRSSFCDLLASIESMVNSLLEEFDCCGGNNEAGGGDEVVEEAEDNCCCFSGLSSSTTTWFPFSMMAMTRTKRPRLLLTDFTNFTNVFHRQNREQFIESFFSHHKTVEISITPVSKMGWTGGLGGSPSHSSRRTLGDREGGA